MDPADELPIARGLILRSLLVLLLLERRQQMRVCELVVAVRRSGFAVFDRPSKEIADALRWEVARGRVVRIGRGVYAPGHVAKVTRHRMRQRVAENRNQSTLRAGPVDAGYEVIAPTRPGR
jgi:hypothetical protein